MSIRDLRHATSRYASAALELALYLAGWVAIVLLGVLGLAQGLVVRVLRGVRRSFRPVRAPARRLGSGGPHRATGY